jgi:uncharacterized repeat protein (TIGR03806 family)
MKRYLFLSFFILAFFIGCSPKQDKPIIIEEVSLENVSTLPGPKKLSEWELFEGNLKELTPTTDLIPYDLNTPLFTDYASKLRLVKLPKETSARYEAQEVLGFPEGTILVKNFFYKAAQLVNQDEPRIIETRLLIHEVDGWKALTYVWNEDQTEAYLEVAGSSVLVHIVKDNGESVMLDYSVPNLVQCKSCHEKNGKMTPIGPSVRQLNKDFVYQEAMVENQIDRWKALGMLEGIPAGNLPKLPVWDDEATGTLSERARAWLEINCAHCHQSAGPAKNSGLYLEYNETEKYRLGINKPPVAAGRGSAGLKYAIVPGHPDQSFLLYRISSTDPGTMMPELGRKLVHEEGVSLISDWIASLD